METVIDTLHQSIGGFYTYIIHNTRGKKNMHFIYGMLIHNNLQSLLLLELLSAGGRLFEAVV